MQAGNYAWGRHLKRSTAQVEDDFDGEGSMLDSPHSLGANTPGGQSPDAMSETGKGKRRHTMTAKAMEAEQGKKRRQTTRNDDEATPSQSQSRQLSASTATSGGASSVTNLSSRFKQSHHPSPLAVQATYSDEMEIDSNGQQIGHSNSTTPDVDRSQSSKSSSFAASLYPLAPSANVVSQVTSQEWVPLLMYSPKTPSGPPIMIRRVAPAYAASPSMVSYNAEEARQHSANMSREARSTMTDEQLYRANHPPASPYDMAPIPKLELRAAKEEPCLDKQSLLARKWEAGKTKLEKDIEKEVEARKKLIKSTHRVKNLYNDGNEKLAGLSKEYTDPDTPLERKKELSQEFNEIQKWMTSEKNKYNSMRDQSAAMKRRIEAKNLELSQLRYFILLQGEDENRS